MKCINESYILIHNIGSNPIISKYQSGSNLIIYLYYVLNVVT